MLDKYQFWQGFSIGTGIIFSFFVFVFIPYLILKMIKTSSDKEVRIHNINELSIEIMEEYSRKLEEAELYEELAEFEKYMESFKNQEPMKDFFHKYEILEDSILFKYFIERKRNL